MSGRRHSGASTRGFSLLGTALLALATTGNARASDELTTFTIAPSAGKGSSMVETSFAPPQGQEEEPQLDLAPPPATTPLTLDTSAGWRSATNAFDLQLGASGLPWGIRTSLSAAAQMKDTGFSLRGARVALRDARRHWSFAAGDLYSDLYGNVRGVRAGLVMESFDTSVALCLPAQGRSSRFGSHALTLQHNHRLGSDVELAAEVGTDQSGTVRLEWNGSSVRSGFIFGADLSEPGEARLTPAIWASAELFDRTLQLLGAARMERADGRSRLAARLGAVARITPRWEANAMWTGTGSEEGFDAHSVKLAVRTRQRAISASVTGSAIIGDGLEPRYEVSSHIAWRAAHWLSTWASARLSREGGDGWRPDGTIGIDAKPAKTTLVRVQAMLPAGSLTPEINASWKQDLPAAFSVDVDISLRSPGGGADMEPSFRVGLSKRFSVDVPSGGAEISGRAVSMAGAPVAGVVIQLGPYRVLTDDEGRYSFDGLSPGRYDLALDGSTLPADSTMVQAPREVDVSESTTTEIFNFEVVKYGAIAGRVCIDSDADGDCVPEEGVPHGLLRLGERMTSPEPDGSFRFDNLLPGTHEVQLDESYLRRGWVLAGPGKRTVEVLEGQAASAQFFVDRKRKEIRFQEL